MTKGQRVQGVASIWQGLVVVSLVSSCLAVILTASSTPAAAKALHNTEVPVCAGSQEETQAGRDSGTIILASGDDPYYALAQEIAGVEGSTVVQTLEEALAGDPQLLLWVVSPASVSDDALVHLGLAMGERDPADDVAPCMAASWRWGPGMVKARAEGGMFA